MITKHHLTSPDTDCLDIFIKYLSSIKTDNPVDILIMSQLQEWANDKSNDADHTGGWDNVGDIIHTLIDETATDGFDSHNGTRSDAIYPFSTTELKYFIQLHIPNFLTP